MYHVEGFCFINYLLKPCSSVDFIFLNCEIDACICVGFIFLNEKSSEQKDVKKQRIFTIIGWGMVVLFFSLILSVFRSKYHGYPYRSVSFSRLFIFVCVILSCLQFSASLTLYVSSQVRRYVLES